MGAVQPRDRRLSAALFGKTRRAVLALLLGRPDDALYLRQIVRAIRCGQGGVQRELRRLTDAGIILRADRDRSVVYQANRACLVFTELRALVLKTAGAGGLLPGAAPVREQRPTAPPEAVGRRLARAPGPARRPRQTSRTWLDSMPSELL